MSQFTTTKSLARAFRMMKGMMKGMKMKGTQAQEIEWGEDYRGAAGAALKAILEGHMVAGVDQPLAEMATRGEADRRNGSYQRQLTTELGEIELGVPRTRNFGARKVVRAYARRALPFERCPRSDDPVRRTRPGGADRT